MTFRRQAPPRFPAPSAEYDRTNEAAFRVELERVVGSIASSGDLEAVEGVIGIRGTLVTVTGAYVIADPDGTVLANANGGAFTVTLPLAADNGGRIIVVKKIDASANVVTLDGNGVETVDGAETLSLSVQYEAYNVQSDGTAWWII